MPAERFIGIDIGGTSTRVARSPSLEVPNLESKIVFPTTNDFDHDYQRITGFINSNLPIKGVGIGIPGSLNEDRSMVLSAANMPSYINKPLPALLSKRYFCETCMENDATVAGLGEALYGTTDKSNFIYIIWGTGVGGARIDYQNGKPTSSKLDWHTYLQPWENACGGNSLRKSYGKSAEQFNDKDWGEIMERFSGELLSFLDKIKTERIIFGGGIAIKQSVRLKQLTKNLRTEFTDRLPLIEISKLGEDAGLYGALGLLKN